MKHVLMVTTAAGLFVTGPALAQEWLDEAIAGYQSQQADFIEVSRGPTQVKIEATVGTQTLEVIYDAETGVILKSEQDAADPEYIGRSGIEFDRDDDDFLDDDDSDDDDDDSDDDRDDDDDDDSDDDRDDDSSDDDSSDDNGGDDDDGDDD